MRRTKQWWKKFSKAERSYIVYFEKQKNKFHSYGGGGYLPDDSSECPVCGNPMLGSGTCKYCYDKYDSIIKKADKYTTKEQTKNDSDYLTASSN